MSQQFPDDVWLIGYGNPGRCDDGLGPAFAESIEKLQLPGVTVESDYQLTVEDAAEAAEHKTILFADATMIGTEPFWIKRVRPDQNAIGFSSHGVEPEAVLALTRDLFGVEPEAYLIGIRGYEFDTFGMELSSAAHSNLNAAVAYLQTTLLRGILSQTVKPQSNSLSLKTRNHLS